MTPPNRARFSAESSSADARENVLDRLSQAYERHCEAEQMARAQNDKPAEEQAHNAVVIVLRAYQAEQRP